ncbi:MAG: hypothetical protein EOO06_09605 [Chitinophagaceae bacterium]|nr:MAG: hypothetical protein EOO06_09605 [Chitinophagaceae bacterium]
MYRETSENIILLIVLSSILMLILVGFIATIIYKYQQNQNAYFKKMEEVKLSFETTLLQSQVEIQEKTFADIAREIHDNIGQKLALAKLMLNTLPFEKVDKLKTQVETSVDILGTAVVDLSRISRGMNNEIVLQDGIIRALEAEVQQIKNTSLYSIQLEVIGDGVFLTDTREVILFRIIQEVLHNIIKHANATEIQIVMDYKEKELALLISDNGQGFDLSSTVCSGTGLKNIKKRIQLLEGTYDIDSSNEGTQMKINIPFYESNNFIQNYPGR